MRSTLQKLAMVTALNMGCIGLVVAQDSEAKPTEPTIAAAPKVDEAPIPLPNASSPAATTPAPTAATHAAPTAACPPGALEDLEVKFVWIDNASQPIASSGVKKFSADGKTDPQIEDLKKQLEQAIADLKKCQDARKCRNELATASATLRLAPRCGQEAPYKLDLSAFDLMESEKVSFIDANPGVSLHWFPANSNCLPGSLPSSPTESVPTKPVPTDKPAPNPGNGAPPPPVTPPLDELPFSALPPATSKNLDRIVSSNGVLFGSPESLKQMVGPIANQSVAGDGENKLSTIPKHAYLRGKIDYFTYKQPSLPWQAYYELEGANLRQWFRVGNFSGYVWPENAHITLTDVNIFPRQKFEFTLSQQICPDEAALLRVNEFLVLKQQLVFNLDSSSQHPTSSLFLDESEMSKAVAGDVRGQFQGSGFGGKVRVGKDHLIVDAVPAFAASSKPEDPEHKLVGLRLGKFQVSQRRVTKVHVDDFETSARPVTTIRLEMKADPENWTLQTNTDGWTLDKKKSRYLWNGDGDFPGTSKDVEFSEQSTPSNMQQLDFFDEGERKSLAAVLKESKDRGETSPSLSVLARAFEVHSSMVEKNAALEDLDKSIADLDQQYNKTDEKYQSRLIAINQELVRLNQKLRTEAPTLMAESAALQTELDRLLSTDVSIVAESVSASIAASK